MSTDTMVAVSEARLRVVLKEVLDARRVTISFRETFWITVMVLGYVGTAYGIVEHVVPFIVHRVRAWKKSTPTKKGPVTP